MKRTTLCYIEHNGSYLMLNRNKKKNDLNIGKWIGVGGHIENGETPEACVCREVLEETGLTLHSVRFRGVIDFISDRWPSETMYLYTSDDYSGELTDCVEGSLEWIRKETVFSLPLWEGDRIFLNYLLMDRNFFRLRLEYDEQDKLKKDILLPNLILASASPRRKELLGQIGLDPAVVPSSVEEIIMGTTPDQIVRSLSEQKARDIADKILGNADILGADTVVTVDGVILGKPHSHEEAAEMIRSLQGRSHEVYTGVTIIRKSDGQERSVSFAERTLVRVAPMTDPEIELYSQSEEPMDKAGSYGIQGTFAAFIDGIDGDYTNVVGLPVGRVYRTLRDL